jgi:peptidoglycan/LPS O-acetylase OafA/YrhL
MGKPFQQGHENNFARIPALDGIRGIAILLVLIWHYVVSSVKIEPHTLFGSTMHVLGLGWSGVDLFFVLSGFLIGGILLDNRDASNFFKVFYIRRICRIFPLYFLWIFLFLWMSGAVQGWLPSASIAWLFSDPLPFWSYLTFTQNIVGLESNSLGPNWIAITWSLAVEEQFYLFLPLLIRFTRLNRLPYVLGSLILLAPLLRLMFFYWHPNAGLATYILMPCRADALLLGVMGAYLVRLQKIRQMLEQHSAGLYGLLIVFILGIAVLMIQDQMLVSLGRDLGGYFLLALTYTCFLLIAVTEKQGLITWITRNSMLRHLGLLAYGVYLFHQAVAGLFHGLFRGQIPQLNVAADWLITLGALLSTIVMAFFSWTFFEKRFVAFGHSYQYKEATMKLDSSRTELEFAD